MLIELQACPEAVEWVRQFKTLQAAWDACERGDWMLWLAGLLSGRPGSDSRRKLVRAVCACARLALPLFEDRYPQDKRPRISLETAERYAVGQASIEEVKTAADAAAAAAAYPTAYTTAAAAAADAAYAAAYAAAAAYATAYATAYTAADAAADAAYATAYAAGLKNRTQILKVCADEVRKIYPKVPKTTDSNL